MIREKSVKLFLSGVQNRISDELIKDDALSDALGWITKDGHIELARGRKRLGNAGAIGSVPVLHAGYTVNGTSVMFKKAGTKVQTLVGETWTDVITGLNADAPLTFSNYSSLAGTFTYVFSTDGIWKICTANPTDVADMYDPVKNFKGLGLINQGRTVLWGREKNPTGFYGSWVDGQDGVVYTTVAAEALADVASGTLAFKSGQPRRTCFGVQVTVTGSGQIFTDNFDGTLTGDGGGTGTINYMTGAFTTDDTGAGTAEYQWENTNNKGVTDFSKSVPRQAGEGFFFPQDFGGDAIQQVHPLDGSYFSIKENTVYELKLSDDDTAGTNQVFRSNLGMPSRNSSVNTSKGILFLDTSVTDTPRVRYLTRNIYGDNFDIEPIFEQFDFSKYKFDDATMHVYGNYMLLACKSQGATANNIILMCNFIDNTVDILSYEALSFVAVDGNLYSGDSLSHDVYFLMNGFDDLGYTIRNFAETKNERFGTDDLKKVKRLRISGFVAVGQEVDVYGSFDEDVFELIGNISGDGTYVDIENPNTIGLNLIGHDVIGGSDSQLAYPFYLELKIKTPKFRKRKYKFVAKKYGYFAVTGYQDYDIWLFEGRMPKRNRLKQNVSINDSTSTDNADPNY